MKVDIGRYPKDDSKERKVNVKIDKWDNWNLDHTLALILYPALLDFKSAEIGCHYVDSGDVPESLRNEKFDDLTYIPWSDAKDSEEYDTYLVNRWNYVLDEMIFAFGQIANHDHDMVDEELSKRISNGTRLFGVYFQALWT